MSSALTLEMSFSSSSQYHDDDFESVIGNPRELPPAYRGPESLPPVFPHFAAAVSEKLFHERMRSPRHSDHGMKAIRIPCANAANGTVRDSRRSLSPTSTRYRLFLLREQSEGIQIDPKPTISYKKPTLTIRSR
jgi:hypothetical protein